MLGKVSLLILLPLLALALPVKVDAQATNCLQGYVWREASSQDFVCVTPQSRALTKQENTLALSRREPGPRNGLYYAKPRYLARSG